MGVNISVNIGVNMVVDLRFGSTQMLKLNLTLFQHIDKKGIDRLTDVRTE